MASVRAGGGAQVGGVTVKYNRGAKLKILQSSGVESALLAIAKRVASRASAHDGVTYAAWSDNHHTSAHAHATTTDLASMAAQAESNSLVTYLSNERQVS